FIAGVTDRAFAGASQNCDSSAGSRGWFVGLSAGAGAGAGCCARGAAAAAMTIATSVTTRRLDRFMTVATGWRRRRRAYAPARRGNDPRAGARAAERALRRGHGRAQSRRRDAPPDRDRGALRSPPARDTA